MDSSLTLTIDPKPRQGARRRSISGALAGWLLAAAAIFAPATAAAVDPPAGVEGPQTPASAQEEAAKAAAAAEAQRQAAEAAAAEAAREREDVRARMAAIRADLEAERTARVAAQTALRERVDAMATRAADAPPTVGSARVGLGLTGFVQADLMLRQSSQDQLNPAGAPLNQETFLVRRARLKATL